MVRILTRALLLSVAFCAQIVFAGDTWLSNIKPLNDAIVVATPDDKHELIIQNIKAAQKSVQMSMYHLTDNDIIQALIEAQGRKVNVQLLLDSASLSGAKYVEVFKQIQAAHIDVHASSPLFRITHTKSFVVDGKLAYISTMNLVGRYQDMRDYGIFTTDADIIRELTTVFQTDMKNGRDSTDITPALTNPNLVWSPINSGQKLKDLIDSAKTSIALAVENLGNDTVVREALIAARARGISVRVMTPECNLGTSLFNYPALYDLQKAGAEVHVMPYPSSAANPYMHAKLIMVDRQKLFLGSENFSFSSLNLSREVGVVLTNPKAIEAVERFYEKDWQVTKVVPETPPTICPTTNF